MTFTWQEIECDWLIEGGHLATPPEVICDSFNQLEAVFGRSWLESLRIRSGVVERGLGLTLHVVNLSLMLKALGKANNSERLVEAIRRRQPDAWAELMAVYLLRSGRPEIELELEPEINVNGRNRKPDCRTRFGVESSWTYVEVTQATGNSKAQRAVHAGLERLTSPVDGCAGSFAVEVFLHRDPNDDELDHITDEIRRDHSRAGQTMVELPAGLGALYWNMSRPGQAILENHGMPHVPRLGAMRTAMGKGYHRHIFARWPFIDARAITMLDAEARQLAVDAPGLVMIHVSGAGGAMKEWEKQIRYAFQPTMRRRISGACLFTSAMASSQEGEYWQIECRFIANPYARFPLPSWIATQFERFPPRTYS